MKMFYEPKEGEMYSKQRLGAEAYPGVTFDTALPHEWVMRIIDNMGPEYDPVPHFVWLYEAGDFMGKPAPVTRRGLEIMMTAMAIVGFRRL